MIFENILLEKQEKINIITINRPESLNALNGKTIKEISGDNVYFFLFFKKDIFKNHSILFY
jgi:1,4-dihydroxy-2-naphthoyl-CoA synthase